MKRVNLADVVGAKSEFFKVVETFHTSIDTSNLEEAKSKFGRVKKSVWMCKS